MSYNKGYIKEDIHIKEHTPPKSPSGPPPDPDVCVFGKFVKLSKKDYEEISELYGKQVLEGLIAEMNDYLASSGKKPYDDYAAALRQWIKRRGLQPVASKTELETPTSPPKPPRVPTAAEADFEWLEGLRTIKAVLALQNEGRLMYEGEKYVYFPDIPGAKFFFGEGGFRSMVENTLRKMNIYFTKESHP